MFKINIGIVGTSRIAEDHVKALLAIKEFNLYGITSRTNLKSPYFKKKYNFNTIYKSYIEMAKDPNIQAMVIVVSSDQSFKVIKDLIVYKKPFFTEKPAGINYEQSKKLYELYLKNKTPNIVGFNRRYYSVFEKGLRIINKKGGIKAINIEGHERFWKIKNNKKTNILNNWIYVNNIHVIDLIRFFGGDVKKFINTSKNFFEKFNDYHSVTIDYESNIIGNYTSYWNSPGGWSVKLFGDGITVVFDPLEKGYWMGKNLKKHLILPNKKDINHKAGFFKQMQVFKDLINLKKIKNISDLESSYKSMFLAKKLLS